MVNQPQQITPALPTEQSPPPTLLGTRILLGLWRHRVLILATVVATVVTGGAYSLLFTSSLYQGSAMLTIAPSPLNSQLKDERLATAGYRRLLESDEVINETKERLVELGLLEPDRPLAVGGQLQSRVEGTQAEGVNPLIEAIAVHESSETAATIANVWTEVFIEKSLERQVSGLAPTLELVEAEFQRQRDELAALRQQKADQLNDFTVLRSETEFRWLQEINDAEVRWDRRLVGIRKETADVTAAYQAETRRMIEAFADSKGLGEPGDPAVPTPGGAAGVGEPLNGLDSAILRRLRQLVTLRVQLAQTVPLLVLEKAITEDALWQVLALQETPTTELEGMSGRTKLLTEEINPLSTELGLRIAEIEAEVSLLINDSASPVLEAASELEALQRQRSAGLSKLFADRKLEFDRTERTATLELTETRKRRHIELSSLDATWEAQLAALNQNLEKKEQRLSELTDLNEQALSARAEEGVSEVRLRATAVPAQVPLPRGHPRRALLAAVLGFLLGCTLALLQEKRLLGSA